MHNVVKYVWPFYNIMHERVKYGFKSSLKVLNIVLLNQTIVVFWKNAWLINFSFDA